METILNHLFSALIFATVIQTTKCRSFLRPKQTFERIETSFLDISNKLSFNQETYDDQLSTVAPAREVKLLPILMGNYSSKSLPVTEIDAASPITADVGMNSIFIDHFPSYTNLSENNIRSAKRKRRNHFVPFLVSFLLLLLLLSFIFYIQYQLDFNWRVRCILYSQQNEKSNGAVKLRKLQRRPYFLDWQIKNQKSNWLSGVGINYWTLRQNFWQYI